MKKLFFSIVAASTLMSACHHASPATKTGDSSATISTTGTSTMKFETESHDFGRIKEGDKVNFKFNFTNTGKTPLIISNAVASCGCTTPDWPKGPVAPGANSQISVTFNSTGHPGLTDKMITITANTNPPQNVVHLIGEVVKK